MNFRNGNMVWASAFQQGDTEAFNQVYRMHYHALFLFAFKLIDDEAEAEDIVTESLIKLWQRHKDFDNLPQIKAFLYTTTRNACLNFLKKSQRQSNYKTKLLAELAEGEDYVFSKMVYAELLQEVHREIERLPPKPRKVFELSFFEDLTNPEIAERLNMPAGKVKNNKSRAYQLLRLALGKDFLPAVIFFLLRWAGF